MKEGHIFRSNRCVHIKEINQWDHNFLVEWSCTNESLNERGPYIFVEWSCANKRNKSVGHQILVEWSCILLRLKSRIARGASYGYHPAFMGSWPNISHTFSALSSRWMNLFRKWGHGVSTRFHRIVLVFGVNQEN